ncbi:MAG: VTT domain-containing protein [Bacteroidales bacterium]|nr:VTT domain-containing protein [Bacteroidales bacterium]
MRKAKIQYIIRNILKGLAWLGLFVILYILSKKYIDFNFIKWLEPIYANTILMYTIFLVSEIIVGIIPPEVFIIWALRSEDIQTFAIMVSILAVISYLTGLLGYLIGHYLSRSLFYRFMKRKFLKKLDSRLQIFGMYLILIAALTPVPFSGTSMLIGSVNYPFKRFSFLALTRFLRFVIYALVFWELGFIS